MIESITYAMQLEKKLIIEFKKKFFDKMGYIPIIVTKTSLNEEDIPIVSLEDLEKAFKPFLPTKNGKQLTLKSNVRYREIVDLRKMFCAIARAMKYSLKSIGKYIERDHTTVIHCINSFNGLFDTNENFKTIHTKILKNIRNNHGTPIMDYFNQAQPNTKSDLPIGLL